MAESQQYQSMGVDALTSLEGNYAFLNLLSSMAQQKKPCEIMVLGIDNFKSINSLYTYSFGDKVLQHFAWELSRFLPADALLFRLDGDSFGIVCMGETIGQCSEIYHKIPLKPRIIDGLSVSFTVSAGICQCPAHGEDGNQLFDNANLALTQAKSGTKKSCRQYVPEMSERIKRDMLLLERLRNSVAQDFSGFSLCFQPIMKSDTKELHGCEALLRWHDKLFPDGVSPYLFVPLLERSGLIGEVGQWVIRTAFAQCAAWQKTAPDLCMNINVSARQLDDSAFPAYVMQQLSDHGLPPQSITLELTESAQNDFEKIQKSFDYLRKQGLQTALDDFGTGYASLDIFRQVSADELKIDRSFLDRITDDVTDQVLLKSIIDMCRKMNIVVCVEGVENPDIEHVVSQMKPQLLQGYQYSRPIPPEQFAAQYLSGHVAKASVRAEQSPVVYSKYRPAKPMTFSAIVNNAHSGIFQVGMDEEFTFLTCNEGYRRMLGYTAREMEERFGNKALGFVHPDDMEAVNEEIRNQLGQGDTVTIEFRVVRADGCPIWILGTGNVVRSSSGNPSLIVNIIENDKRKTESLRREKLLAQYEKILTLLPTGIKYIRYDADFTIEYISPGFLSILGFTLQEVMEDFEGKYINLIYEEDRQQVFNDALNQVQSSDVVLLRYRSVCKDGRLVWMETVSRLCPADEDGIQRCCSSVVDVTETITPEEKSRALNITNRVQKASRLWGEVMFEYNFITGKMVMSESFIALFGYPLPENGAIDPALIFQKNTVHLMQLLSNAQAGAQLQPIEIAARRADGETIWCRVLVHPSDKIGEAMISAIGKIINITEEYTEREQLRLASQTDSLTKLYNKGAIEMNISQLLVEQPTNTYACWILDVDDFKRVNDTLGHLVGDRLLQAIAERLQQAFRKTDILGRIGGDEYLIFAECDGDAEWLANRGEQVMELLREPLQLGEQMVYPTLSVGIACYPKDGTTFSELYPNADKALYRVKAAGKNGFCIYS